MAAVGVAGRLYAIAWILAATVFAYGIWAWFVLVHDHYWLPDNFSFNDALQRGWWVPLPDMLDRILYYQDYWFNMFFDRNANVPLFLTMWLPLLIIGRWLMTGQWTVTPR